MAVRKVNKHAKTGKLVYFFGNGKAEGDAGMKNLLGGKGANLAEMASLGLPVPPGFTITTEVCTHYYANGRRYPAALREQVAAALSGVEKILALGFGDPNNPLLLSVRSGARSSMPGMMETVLNVGLTSATIPGMIKKMGSARFVYDAYRRLIMMYADVVMEKAAGIEPAEGHGVRMQLEHLLEDLKKSHGYTSDTQITAPELEDLCNRFKTKVREVIGKEFPDNAVDQLWGGIGAVFQSWNGRRAISYRKIEGIPDDWGTAVTVQSMVFGNMGEDCATGVAFSRNPGTGENGFFGEWLVNAQGEDVVAGIRTPNALNEHAKTDQSRELPTLENTMPLLYKELVGYRNMLEKHYGDMQDLEFTIQSGRLFMLQTRVGKRNGPAALRMAVEMVRERLIDKPTAVSRVRPNQLDELYHPMVDPLKEKEFKPLTKGLPAGPGGATGGASSGCQASTTSRNENGGNSVVTTRPARLSRVPLATRTLEDPVTTIRARVVSARCFTSSFHRGSLWTSSRSRKAGAPLLRSRWRTLASNHRTRPSRPPASRSVCRSKRSTRTSVGFTPSARSASTSWSVEVVLPTWRGPRITWMSGDF